MSSVTFGRIFIFLLFVCPSPYVVAALGGSASPAMLIGLVMFGWWIITRVTPSVSTARTRQPIRVAAYILIASVFASAAAAFARVLPPEEAQAPLRGISIVLAIAGVALFFADGLKNRIEIEKIVSALIYGGAFVGVIGLLQFATGDDIAPYLKLPGLSAVNDFTFISERNGLPRVSGTAYHPIEYAVVLCVIWPFALRNAVMNWTKKARLVSLIPFIVISAALPTALSRTAIVALGLIIGTIWFTWTARRRLRFIMATALGAAILFIFAPQVPKVLIDLFTKADEDISITTRTEDYSKASDFIRENPFFGRGFKTFDPGSYFFLDNQYLLSLIETGIIGTTALLAFFVVGITLARNVKHTAKDPFFAELGQCCASSLFAILICFATFDTMSFPMIAFTSTLIIGLSAAMWRVNRYENGDETMAFASIDSRIIKNTDKLPTELATS